MATQLSLSDIEENYKGLFEAWEEEWRPVPIEGIEDFYEVSNKGRLCSYVKPGIQNDKPADTPRIMSLSKSAGYPCASLRVEKGEYIQRRIHRLVLKAFVGPCPEGYEAAHLNGDRTDNRIDNLKWVTHKENEAHKRKHGTAPVGEQNAMAKLSGWQIAEIKYLRSQGVPQAKLARLFDTSRTTIHEILQGEKWSHIEPRKDIKHLVNKIKELKGRLAK